MRLKDIEVGKDYAYSRSTRPSLLTIERVTVLEVGVYRRVFDNWRMRDSAHADGVMVRFHSNPREVAVPAREVLKPWAEHEPEARAAQEAEAKRKAAINEQMARVTAALDTAGIVHCAHTDRLRVTIDGRDALDALLRALPHESAVRP